MNLALLLSPLLGLTVANKLEQWTRKRRATQVLTASSHATKAVEQEDKEHQDCQKSKCSESHSSPCIVQEEEHGEFTSIDFKQGIAPQMKQHVEVFQKYAAAHRRLQVKEQEFSLTRGSIRLLTASATFKHSKKDQRQDNRQLLSTFFTEERQVMDTVQKKRFAKQNAKAFQKEY